MLVATLIAAVLAPQYNPHWQKPDPAEVRKAVGAAVEKTRMKRGRPAVMLAVVVDDKVFLTHAEGKIGEQRVATDATLFPMGTLSRVVANLTFARMDKAKQIDLRQQANKALRPFVLRDEDDTAVDNTLAEILFDAVKLPYYANWFPVAQAGRWSAERAVLDNAFIPSIKPFRLRSSDWGRDNDQLAYAVVQHAAQRATQRSWTALVGEHVAKPLGMKEFIADGRTGLPTTTATGYGKGLFGLKLEQRNILTGVAAGGGAWIHSRDLGRLLRTLLAEAKGQDSEAAMSELTESNPVFANFHVNPDPHPHLRLDGQSPGMLGGVAVYPQFGRAFGVFANYQAGDERGMPGIVRSTLEKQLLPKPQPKGGQQWNTAVGIGGGVGGVMVRQLPERFTGVWQSKVRFAGKERSLEMWIARHRVTHVRFEGQRRRAVTTRVLGSQVHITGSNLLPVRKDVSPPCKMVLIQSTDGGETRFYGNLELRSKTCWMTFRVAFTKVK